MSAREVVRQVVAGVTGAAFVIALFWGVYLIGVPA